MKISMKISIKISRRPPRNRWGQSWENLQWDLGGGQGGIFGERKFILRRWPCTGRFRSTTTVDIYRRQLDTMFKEEVYPGLDLVDVCLLAAMVLGPLLGYMYFSFAVRQMGVNGLLLTMAIPTFLCGCCGLLISSEAPTLFKFLFPSLTNQLAESSQFVVAISSILAIPPVVNLVVDGKGFNLFSFWALALLALGVLIELNTRSQLLSFVPYVVVVPKLLEATGVALLILTLASTLTKKEDPKEA